jgi:hypothetical protein
MKASSTSVFAALPPARALSAFMTRESACVGTEKSVPVGDA